MELTKGAVFAENYIISSVAGFGGTATVYEAYDTITTSAVALKIFDKNPVSREILAEVWSRETSALNKMNHVSIVRFITAGTDRKTNLKFIVTEWLKGESLGDQLLAVGSINWSVFFRDYGDQILDGLCYAFENNVIHRDISLENIFVLPGKKLKIIDFGVAKIDDKPVGVTVAEFKTPIFGAPEPDTPQYTNTRDPYSFSAIVVRAVIGRNLVDHNDLYGVLKKVEIPQDNRSLITDALSRSPEARPRNIIEFTERLSGPTVPSKESELELSIRCSPGVIDKHNSFIQLDAGSAIDNLVVELNDIVAIHLPKIDMEQENRICIDTRSFHLTVDIDSRDRSTLVIIGLGKKYFQLDSMYKEGYWTSNNLRFTDKPPRTPKEKQEKSTNIQKLYENFNHFLQAQNSQIREGSDGVFEEWSRILEALRFIARNEKKPLRYSRIAIEGRRISVELLNPQDAEVGEIRFVAHHGRSVLSAEIEEIKESTCHLYSQRPTVNIESIPSRGILEQDWRQARVALDRQSTALDAFTKREIVNNKLRSLIIQEKFLDEPAEYNNVPLYFDKFLDEDKKRIVSQFLAMTDLLLIHGPPGTGKSRLIIELINQELSRNSDSKILLVSQTHVAIDNVLEPLLGNDREISIVRIGSGSKEMSKAVEKSSIDARGKQILSEIHGSSRRYVKKIAANSSTDMKEVEIGMKAAEVLYLRRDRLGKNVELNEIRSELQKIEEELRKIQSSTLTRSDELGMQARAQILDEEIAIKEGEIAIADGLLSTSERKLYLCGEDGKSLAALEDKELGEWCDELLSGNDKQHIRELLKISEEWHAKLENSEDFKVAIIDSTQVVAGTCIGFCRERAASLSEYDLCIVDEASKATTTELLVPMARAKKVVLVGDHHQLPAVIDHAILQRDIQDQYRLTPEQFERQLFEILQTGLPDKHRAALVTQHRMRPAIGNLISSCFYNGELKNSESLSNDSTINMDVAGLTHAVTWIDTDSEHEGDAQEKESGKSFVNLTEVDCILSLLRRISFMLNQTNSKLAATYTVGVISGYAAQTKYIRREIRREVSLDKLNVTCDTVHAFQGRQVDICIYSITRNNKIGKVGFLSDWRHLNVALSRAKEFLVLVGGLDFCEGASEPNPFRDVVDYVCNEDSCEVRGWSD